MTYTRDDSAHFVCRKVKIARVFNRYSSVTQVFGSRVKSQGSS